MFMNNSLSSTNLSNQLENLRYNQVEKDYVVCIISLYFPSPMTAKCLFHGEHKLSLISADTSMSNSSFLLSPPFSYSVAVLYITCYYKTFILGLKACFFNHCSLYLTLFDLYTSVIFTQYRHHQVKTWSEIRYLFS